MMMTLLFAIFFFQWVVAIYKVGLFRCSSLILILLRYLFRCRYLIDISIRCRNRYLSFLSANGFLPNIHSSDSPKVPRTGRYWPRVYQGCQIFVVA
jgi:hypothetical protein